jgi:hypothetical protein
MRLSTYLRPNIHQNGPEILGVNNATYVIRNNTFFKDPVNTLADKNNYFSNRCHPLIQLKIKVDCLVESFISLDFIEFISS